MTTRKDQRETESMLHRLGECLAQHAIGEASMQCRADAESLRRISMTLHRWHELECNEDIQRRGDKQRPFIVRQTYKNASYSYQIPDSESGALKRLKKIMARYPALQAYVQTDPRGCALYILRPGDVPEGATVDSCYSRGIAVYR